MMVLELRGELEKMALESPVVTFDRIANFGATELISRSRKLEFLESLLAFLISKAETHDVIRISLISHNASIADRLKLWYDI